MNMYVILPHNNIIKKHKNINKYHLIFFASHDINKTKKLLYYLNNYLTDPDIIESLTLIRDHTSTKNLFHMKSVTNEELINNGFYDYNYAQLKYNVKMLHNMNYVNNIDNVMTELKPHYSNVLCDVMVIEGLIGIIPNSDAINIIKKYHRDNYDVSVLNAITKYMNDDNIL